jgi:glycine/D-amino acid oxidase-like deaminating enzyme
MIRETVLKGDSVVIVGGGYGVSAVYAAHVAGPDGSVVVFEPTETLADAISETLSINEVEHVVELRDEAIANYTEYAADEYGHIDAKILAPTELPPCDVLELDCEGAEIEILEEMTIRPRAIIVETHGFVGSTRGSIEELVVSRGYEVVDSEPVDSTIGVYVLTAVRKDGG